MQIQNLRKSFQALWISPIWKFIFPTRGAIFIHLCLMTSNSNWWFGNHWSSFFWNLWELPFQKKMFLQSMKEDFQRAHPNLTRKPTAENLKSPTPLSILPNSSWTFQPPPPQEQAKEPELTCCSRLWSSSSPAGTGCFPGKIYGLHLFKAQFVHKHWRTATTLLWSQRRSCLPVVNVFWFLWSFRSSGQWLEELKILKYLVHTYIIMYEYKYIYICIYVCVRPGDVHTHMAKPKKMNFA